MYSWHRGRGNGSANRQTAPEMHHTVPRHGPDAPVSWVISPGRSVKARALSGANAQRRQYRCVTQKRQQKHKRIRFRRNSTGISRVLSFRSLIALSDSITRLLICLFVGVSDRLTAIVDSLSRGERCELPKSVSQKSDPKRLHSTAGFPHLRCPSIRVCLSVSACVRCP